MIKMDLPGKVCHTFEVWHTYAHYYFAAGSTITGKAK
jgi:hypothetical protein